MTAHKLAEKLLAGADLPVFINGWGSDEGTPFEVTAINENTDTISWSALPEAGPFITLDYIQ